MGVSAPFERHHSGRRGHGASAGQFRRPFSRREIARLIGSSRPDQGEEVLAAKCFRPAEPHEPSPYLVPKLHGVPAAQAGQAALSGIFEVAIERIHFHVDCGQENSRTTNTCGQWSCYKSHQRLTFTETGS